MLDQFIWYERYRPRTLKELILPKVYRKKFNSYIEQRSIPHLLLHGPAGSGKTTIGNILIESINAQSLLLNASSGDRGIATIRGKVKEFAASQPFKDRLKVVFLDEADGITPDAQRALKNTIETYAKKTRFLLTANAYDRIIPEISSRCTIFEFEQKFGKAHIIKRLRRILKEEDIKYLVDDLEVIVEKRFPDYRSIVNTVQLCCVEGKLEISMMPGKIDVDLDEVTKLIFGGQLRQVREELFGTTNYTWLFRYLFDGFITKVPPQAKPDVALVIAEYMYRDTQAVDREINFTACLVEIMNTIGVKKIRF